jgi:hypothetical protein
MKSRATPKKAVVKLSASVKSNIKTKKHVGNQPVFSKSKKKLDLTLPSNSKSKSSDTLVSITPTSTPKSGFLDILNTNAVKIQQWYRRSKQRQIREVELEKESNILKRRQLKADMMREVIKQLNLGSIK